MVTNPITNSFSVLSNNKKLLALETSLQQSFLEYKDLLTDLEQMQISFENLKTQYREVKEKCEKQTCCAAEELKTVIQSTQTALTKLYDTKDLYVLNDIFQIVFGKTTTLCYKDIINKVDMNHELPTPTTELHSSAENLSFRDESVPEIEGTPTGRTSPIIQPKKLKKSIVTLGREKKKCSNSWYTPEVKAIKLSHPSPSRGKKHVLRQSRLTTVPIKRSEIIDITSSPEFNGGSRTTNMDIECIVQPLIKKESIENDDTILPSPTSRPSNINVFKSPMKFKTSKSISLSLKTKTERSNKSQKLDIDIENKIIITEVNTDKNDNKHNSMTYTQDDSINILHPNREPPNSVKKPSVKVEQTDATLCETQSSLSILQHVNKLNEIHKQKSVSPVKSPLHENINITNIQEGERLEDRLSVLRDAKSNKMAADNVKRKVPAPVQYDDDDEHPAPRTRAEKRQFPGYACRECIDFYSVLHKDDPEMMHKKINECSHHRGATNPERPKTPPRYWNPRWHVPDDTDEFNRKNNV